MEAQEKVKKERNTSFMKNVAMLVLAQVFIKVLGFLYRLVIINVKGFGDIGNGYYNAGYQVYSLLLTLSSVGIPVVISKLVSERIAIGDNKGAYRIFKISLKIFTSIGIFFSIVLFFGAGFIARNILNVPNVENILKVLSPAIMFVAASAVMRGYFAGLGSQKATSMAQSLEQIFNCILTITFVYALIGKDPATMAMGGNISTTLAIIIAFIYLIIFYKRRKKGIISECESQTVAEEDKTTRNLIKTIFAISIPMTLGSLISVINSTIDTITISNCIQTAYQGIILTKQGLEEKAMELSGMLSKVETIIHLPLAVTAALCTALVPTISASIAKKDMETTNKRLSFSFFIAILLTMPAAFGLAILSKPILQMIYPQYSNGAVILALTTITMIFVSLNYVVNGGLYGFGKIYIPAIALAVGGIIKLVLNILLISNPKVNIYGATISSIVCQGLSFWVCMHYLNKNIKLKIELGNYIIKPIIASIIMGMIAFIIYTLMNKIGAGNAISTIIAIIVGIIVYVLSVLLMKTLKKEDIYMIPYGTKIYSFLVKIKIYKEEIK